VKENNKKLKSYVLPSCVSSADFVDISNSLLPLPPLPSKRSLAQYLALFFCALYALIPTSRLSLRATALFVWKRKEKGVFSASVAR
jgi:hypothetical protein